MRFGASEGHIALITGAGSGIGKAFAEELAKTGCFVILSGRNTDALASLAERIGSDRCVVISADLSTAEGCKELHRQASLYSPDILINNAGIGVFGAFTDTSLEDELRLIDIDIRAMHILFKLFLRDFEKNGRGYILNVGSVAGFVPGPMMSAYYSAKSYVIRQTQAVYIELLAKRSPVRVSVLCPGPVQTPFNKNAGITGSIKGITAEKCVQSALRGMRYELPVIIPSLGTKAVAAASAVLPALVMGGACYIAQKLKKPVE
ncbi:MAG: SDR family NAD(P)-dependent oxidoreductase [Oscillospiraceae bacterium]|nr:SDR family NAD(P)-dependent oxidoreductase [Oscillospiraceae bacterium]